MSTQHGAATPGRERSSAIYAEDLSKCYRIYRKPIHRLWDVLFNSRSYQEFWAVRNVYLDIPHGSTVGIIGENGAGKSSLLKLLTGITTPTTGKVEVQGRIASLLELGAGFHPEFTGRENIRLNCAILGMTPEETAARFQRIVDFSELGDFIDRPVKTYSSGMYVRLGFSVAATVDPDILIIDEALSVGDEHFRGKCTNRLNEIREQGKTVVFVSHDMGAIKSMCKWVILMDQGKVLEQGTAEQVADTYLKRAKARGNERLSMVHRGKSEYPRWGSGEVEVEHFEMLDEHRAPTHVIQTGRPYSIRMIWKAHRECANPVFGVGLYRTDGTYLNGSNHQWREQPIELQRVVPGDEGEVEIFVERMPLQHGQYYLTLFLYDHSKASPTAIDHREHVLTFEVLDVDRAQHGMIQVPSRWTLTRRGPSGTSALESQR
jgi:ABC-type polysaccharide/polyol phosphate transport system ATPase subunit